MHALHNTTRQRLAGLLVVTLAGALSDVTLAQPLPLYGQVVRVVDGDTVVLQDAYGVRHTLRLAGIDAPEKRMPYGQAARQQLDAYVGGQYVTAQPSKQDRYGRTVATITHGGRDVNLAMVQSGMAWHYKKFAGEQTSEEADVYAVSERAARNRGQGLWASEYPVAPWNWRHGGATMHGKR